MKYFFKRILIFKDQILNTNVINKHFLCLLSDYRKKSQLQAGNKKIVKFTEDDLCALLQSLYSSVLSGKDPIHALIKSQEFVPDNSGLKLPLKELKDAINQGEPFENALNKFCRYFNSKEMVCFENIILITIEQGTSLAPILQRLLKVIRQRQSFKQKVGSALALQRISVYGIGACAFFVLVIQFANDKKGIFEALSTKVGTMSYLTGMSLISIGFYMMNQLLKKKF